MTDPSTTPTTSTFGTIIADIRKALAAGTGLVAEGLAVGFLNSTDVKWATIVIGAITTALVYIVPNGKVSTPKAAVAVASPMPPPLSAQPPIGGQGIGTGPPPHG